MNNPNEHQKVRCRNNHTILHYDAQGIHLRCRHCKTVETKSWPEVLQMYHDFCQVTLASSTRALHS
jgi:hypothetical protein